MFSRLVRPSSTSSPSSSPRSSSSSPALPPEATGSTERSKCPSSSSSSSSPRSSSTMFCSTTARAACSRFSRLSSPDASEPRSSSPRSSSPRFSIGGNDTSPSGCCINVLDTRTSFETPVAGSSTKSETEVPTGPLMRESTSWNSSCSTRCPSTSLTSRPTCNCPLAWAGPPATRSRMEVLLPCRCSSTPMPSSGGGSWG
mmetsp:Transcript_28920/g.66895  ORF Transcript_28920/g.66895 Transcript_28920/m.66895 type:complete len:200 (-) Transcript_28920:2340-2939(-)